MTTPQASEIGVLGTTATPLVLGPRQVRSLLEAPGRLLRQLRLCLAEARPVVLVIFQLRFLAGATLGSGHLVVRSAVRVLEGGAVWSSCIVFVYLFNGVMDVTEDAVN